MPDKPAQGVGLRDAALFEGVADATLQDIEARAPKKSLARGETLFSAGDPSSAMYLVLAGRIRIWTVSAAGSEVTLNHLSPGALFGEIGLLDGGERTAAASAAAVSELIAIDRRVFDAALERDTRLARNVIALLCGRLRWVSARLEDSALRSAPERLARMLQHLAQDHGRETDAGLEIAAQLTQTELARWTMMSRESLNKILSRWSDDGLIALDRSKITVLDEDRIEEIADLGEE